MDKDQIRLRPATADDATFVNDLLHRTMHQYVEATWPNEPAAQQKYYEINRFDPSNTRILQRGGEDIGRLSITIRADCIFVDELHILPQYQRRGIGQWVIQNVLEEARQKKLPVKLMVLQANPAQQLYLRLGFKVAAVKDHRLYMEYVPGRRSSGHGSNA